jgi:hypothetical protein
MSFQDQFNDIKQRAKEALRRTNIDAIVGGIGGALTYQIKVSPLAFRYQAGQSEKDLREYVLARCPDLVDLATFAHYELQQEPERKITGAWAEVGRSMLEYVDHPALPPHVKRLILAAETLEAERTSREDARRLWLELSVEERLGLAGYVALDRESPKAYSSRASVDVSERLMKLGLVEVGFPNTEDHSWRVTEKGRRVFGWSLPRG